MVSPTGDVLALMTGVTAPALGTETAAPGPESPTSSPGPGRLWGPPAASQAWTPDAQPGTGGSGKVGQDRNGTGQDTEEDVHGEAPGLGTGQGTASRAPRPTRSSLPAATGGPPDSPGWLLRNSTTQPPARPTPAEGPAGHTVWQASRPTWGTPPAPLEPTRPQDADPGPSSSPDLPSAPSPESAKTPVCGECLARGVLGTMWSV